MNVQTAGEGGKAVLLCLPARKGVAVDRLDQPALAASIEAAFCGKCARNRKHYSEGSFTLSLLLFFFRSHTVDVFGTLAEKDSQLLTIDPARFLLM